MIPLCACEGCKSCREDRPGLCSRWVDRPGATCAECRIEHRRADR